MSKKELEAQFERIVLDRYKKWRAGLPKGDRSGVRYRGMITRLGARQAFKQLLASAGNKRKPDQFGEEKLVTDPRFRSLFTPEEVREAKRRIG